MARFPLRYVLPLLIVSIGALAATLSYVTSVNQAGQQIENVRMTELRDELTRAQGVLESALRAEDRPRAQRYISSFGTTDRLEFLLLVGKDGKVIAATRLSYVGEDLKSLNIPVPAGDIERTTRERTIHVSVPADRRKLQGIASVCYGVSSERNLRVGSCGFLFLQENLHALKAAAANSLRDQALIASGGILVAALVIMILLSQLVTRRVERLVEVTEDIASGHLQSRANLEGHDELTAIGHAINAMLDRIASDQAALAISEERFSLAMKGANDGLWDWNLKTNEVYYSPRWSEMLGYEQYELPARLETWAALVAPEDKDRVLQLVQDHIAGLANAYETEFRMRHKNGSWVTVLSRGFLVRRNGEAVRLVGTHADITRSKELEAQIRQAQKMESIGTLAGGIAHELNNMLLPIQALTEITIEDLPEGSEARKNLSYVLQSAVRAGELVSKVLSFSHHDKAERKNIDLRTVVDDQMELLRSALPATIRFELELGEHPVSVLADETQIHQVLMNLASNAAHAMGGKVGNLTIRLSHFDLNDRADYARLGLASGCYASLSVRDTGHGMDATTLERIFEPFFTTKEVGEGTGMGLAMIHGIVTAHGGAIDVESAPGEGTTFNIYLPLAPETEPVLAVNA